MDPIRKKRCGAIHLRKFVALILVLGMMGCARSKGPPPVISSNLPLSIIDIEEIRMGDKAHRTLLEDNNHLKIYASPELHAYVTMIGNSLTRVSERPALPYRYFILDTDEVDLFGLGGGRIYITRGMFNFIESESELAAVLAHEVGHIASYRYAPDEHGKSKVAIAYDFLMKVSEQGHGLAGAYGSAAHAGLKTAGVVVPKIKRKFTPDEIKEADDHALDYISKAGYDPHALQAFVNRLTQIPMKDVPLYVNYLKAYPPLPARRQAIAEKVGRFQPKKSSFFKVPFRRDKTAEIRANEPIILDPEVEFASELSPEQKNLPAVDIKAALPSAH